MSSDGPGRGELTAATFPGGSRPFCAGQPPSLLGVCPALFFNGGPLSPGRACPRPPDRLNTAPKSVVWRDRANFVSPTRCAVNTSRKQTMIRIRRLRTTVGKLPSGAPHRQPSEWGSSFKTAEIIILGEARGVCVDKMRICCFERA